MIKGIAWKSTFVRKLGRMVVSVVSELLLQVQLYKIFSSLKKKKKNILQRKKKVRGEKPQENGKKYNTTLCYGDLQGLTCF